MVSLQTDLRWPYRSWTGIGGTRVMDLVFCSLEEKTAAQGSSSELVLPLHLCLLFCPCIQVLLKAAVQPGHSAERSRRSGMEIGSWSRSFLEKTVLCKRVFCKNTLDFANASLRPRHSSRHSPRLQVGCLGMSRSL